MLHRLKDLIRQYGPPGALPKNKEKGKTMTKFDYVVTLVDLLRSLNGNDYEKVAKVLAEQTASTGKKKGFGGTVTSGK